ncbi:MAG: hypothetical protein ABJQ14_15635 [Hyphomicrobiales bacterium]
MTQIFIMQKYDIDALVSVTLGDIGARARRSDGESHNAPLNDY